jgi:Mrp family chromosome partitioning ATPase
VNLDVLPVRSVPSNPSELLASPEMRKMMEEVASRYDRVILDTPACLGLPDAKSISELCDALVMVVRAGVTPQEDVQAALDILDRRKVAGLVLNGSESSRQQYGYY